MNNSLLGKLRHGFVQQSVKNVRVKFKVDWFSHFSTEACQVFTTKKLFRNKIPLTMKTATANSI